MSMLLYTLLRDSISSPDIRNKRLIHQSLLKITWLTCRSSSLYRYQPKISIVGIARLRCLDTNWPRTLSPPSCSKLLVIHQSPTCESYHSIHRLCLQKQRRRLDIPRTLCLGQMVCWTVAFVLSTSSWYISENIPGGFAVWAASPEAQFLHGRFVWSTWDVNDLASGELRSQIDSDPWLLKVGVKGL